MQNDCMQFAIRDSFPSYISLLYNATSGNLTALKPCKTQVCSALWGTGNPDVSGIGVIIAYIIELTLGCLLTTSCLLLHRLRTSGRNVNLFSRLSRTSTQAMSSYADAALLVTGSTQLASVVMLVRKDWGLSAADMGDYTIEAMWSICLLTMLPMLLLSCTQTIKLERPQLRLYIISVEWVLFMYTFLSRMINNYTPGQIGSGAGSVISSANWSVIVDICFLGTSVEGTKLSGAESATFSGFAIAGSIFVSLPVVTRLLWSTAKNWNPKWTDKFDRRMSRFIKLKEPLEYGLVVAVLTLGIAQIWYMIRIRQIQSAFALAIDTEDPDNDWSFGQLVAIVAFVPVVFDAVYAWLDHKEPVEKGEAV